VATLPTPTCLTSHSFEDFNDDDDLSQDNSIFSSLRSVDLVSSYLRDSASKDADLQADAAKAPALDDPADDEASADEQDGAVAAPPVPVAPAPAPASILRVPPSRPATKRGGNANMVAFLGGYKQTQARGLLKLGVARQEHPQTHGRDGAAAQAGRGQDADSGRVSGHGGRRRPREAQQDADGRVGAVYQ